MKILALGDPHGKLPKNLDSIIKKNKIEVIVCVGEIPPVPLERHLSKKFQKIGFLYADKRYKEIVDKLCSYGLPLIVMKGNAYLTKRSNNFVRKLFSKYNNLYYRKTGKLTLHKTNFVLFDMVWETHYAPDNIFTKNHMRANNNREKKLNKLLKENKKAILLSHASPYGILDKAYNGKHVGSKILLKSIKRYQPELVLCGHIHEAQGEGKIGKTKIYNLGCCGNYKIIEIGKN